MSGNSRDECLVAQGVQGAQEMVHGVQEEAATTSGLFLLLEKLVGSLSSGVAGPTVRKFRSGTASPGPLG